MSLDCSLNNFMSRFCHRTEDAEYLDPELWFWPWLFTSNMAEERDLAVEVSHRGVNLRPWTGEITAFSLFHFYPY